MNSSALEKRMLETVKNTISTYKMFEGSKDVFVAFSGGKDSITTTLLLTELGYIVHPISIATGDPQFNIVSLHNICRKAGIKVDAIEARSEKIKNMLTEKELAEINWRIEYLDKLPDESNASCTHCYFLKMYILYGNIMSLGGSSVVLGMHRTDMIVSFLKCYWIDLYFRSITKPDGIPYDGARMQGLMNSHERIDISLLKDLVERELAATDDPFVEEDSLPRGFKILRPLGDISERDIVKYMDSKGYIAAGDFCRFKKNWNDSTKAFRLIVHADYNKRYDKTPHMEDEIVELTRLGLSPSGSWQFRPRNNRDSLYPGFKPFIKKL